PRGPVPVLDQGVLVVTAGGVAAHRPGVGGGEGSHAAQVVGDAGAGAGNLRPRGAVPVLDEGQGASGAGGVQAHRPGVTAGGGRNGVEIVGGRGAPARVRGGHLPPRGPVPVHGQGVHYRADAGVVTADRPGVAGGGGGDRFQKVVARAWVRGW